MSITLMAETRPESLVTTPRKRNHDGDVIPRSPTPMQSALTAPTTNTTARQHSPAPSGTGSELTDLTSTEVLNPFDVRTGLDGTTDSTDSASGPAKKRKLTFAEREVEKAVKQREKEEKEKQKAEEKARKEEEKRVRDEERQRKEEEKEIAKRAKELEKAEKQKARDAERQVKEAEKAKRDAEKKAQEQEKLKKERSQMKIGLFFGRPAPQSTPPTTPNDAPSGASSRRSSIAAIDMAEPVVTVEAVTHSNPEFEKYIIPYFIHEHTEIAPTNRFKTIQGRDALNKEPNILLNTEQSTEPLQNRFGPPKKRMKMTEPVKEILDRVQATQINTVDLTGDFNPLASVPYKILSFREDVRPPYTGTYTKRISTQVARKLSRRSVYRGRPDTNYDYDSEAEWEEPAADDEEILDDEMSESDDGEEDMQDFLDDENDQGRKRLFASDMDPISSGICVDGEQYDSNGHNMEDYRMDVLHDSVTFPINPFSTVHWSDIGKPIPTKATGETSNQVSEQTKVDLTSKTMPPPRMPLATVNSPNTLNKFLSPGSTIVQSQNENAQAASSQRGRPANLNKSLKLISDEFMDAFKQAVSGSDLTKAGLIEILKKQFPKCSKDAIKDTLGLVAVRVGKKEIEKKWELV